MSDIDDKKPEEPAAKPKPNDSSAHALTVFAQSLAYSAIEAPARGGAQLIDHALGTKLEEGVQAKLDNTGIHQPEAVHYGTKAWMAAQFGNGIGIVVPMWLSRKAMVGKAEQALVKTASAEGGLVTSLKQTSLAENAFHEAKLSARTGFFYGAALTPTDDKNSSGNIVFDRIKQGFNSGATFGAMGYSSSLSSGLLGRAAGSLEATTLPSVFKSPLQTALHSSLIHGAIGGVPGGIIQTQLGAMESGKHFASLQDIKENVVSMTMVGGAMGGAGLFGQKPGKEAAKPLNTEPPKIKVPANDHVPVIVPNIEPFVANRFDELKATAAARPRSEHVENTVKHHFDIPIDPIERAWKQDDIDKFRTVETRSIMFAPDGRASRIGHESWDNFEPWGVEHRKISVDVYSFPGVPAEIVVPSDYARVLDQERANRLKAAAISDDLVLAGSAANDNFRAKEQRILPEEIAQMLQQLPNHDIVRSVELLDHDDPWDLKKTNDTRTALLSRGETPGPEHNFIGLADATHGNGNERIRFWKGAENNPNKLQETTFHEWAHLLQEDPVFKAFGHAANAERGGFIARPYANYNVHENWAVHLGERFLSPRGHEFAELIENAPARALVMAKAVRNMLDARADNPSPKHEEYLARTLAADALATKGLQESIVSDIQNDRWDRFWNKIRFLNTAASFGESPEMFNKVLGPIDSEVMTVFQRCPFDDAVVNEALLNRMVAQHPENISSEKMPEFIERWRMLGEQEAKVHLFKVLPEYGKQAILNDLIARHDNKIFPDIMALKNSASGADLKMINETIKVIGKEHEEEVLKKIRAKKQVYGSDRVWTAQSENPEIRLGLLKTEKDPLTPESFATSIDGLPPSSLKKLIEGDAIAYVAGESKSTVWQNVLSKLSQNDQIELFQALAETHDAAYEKIAENIEKMDATEFGANSAKIHEQSLKLLLAREQRLDFINAHPDRIKDFASYKEVTQALEANQIADLIRDSAERRDSAWIDDVMKGASERFDESGQLDILTALEKKRGVDGRIDTLMKLVKSHDSAVADRASYMFLHHITDGLEAIRKNYPDMDKFLLGMDDWGARVVYLDYFTPQSGVFQPQSIDNVTLAAHGLSDPQLIRYLQTGASMLKGDDRTTLLRSFYQWQSPLVKDALRTMGDMSGLED
ncbi:MAG: hypothetical protein P4L53_26490 [Candidatus Obscuribacterales bacterium]|nr:hypothetical protein [Candidatus Obscuribacterales bacterium]